jgi:NifB/MoaA-like Fe-S oxidoreductase
VEVAIRRQGQDRTLSVRKLAGETLGLELSSALFDRVRTCDNRCEFCFIHQLPRGLRRSLYVRDDDYRLSFLYGNFTTLTRFTEADLERVLTERLSPLYVSIHATDPRVRAAMLRNPRGAISLRWLEQLLAGGITVHGQVVVCPGVNDGPVLEDTLATVLERYPELASVGVVPLGISRFNREANMMPHTPAQAAAVIDLVTSWQEVCQSCLSRRMVFASDEFYLTAGRELPDLSTYEELSQHENGVGMVAAFRSDFTEMPGSTEADEAGVRLPSGGRRPGGFFASVDGAPAAGYRAERVTAPSARPAGAAGEVVVLTGQYAAPVLAELIQPAFPAVRVLPIENHFFGGNIKVSGLIVGDDLKTQLLAEPENATYLLPDVCLSEGRFLDGLTPEDLPRRVEIVPTNGRALRAALASLEPGE